MAVAAAWSAIAPAAEAEIRFADPQHFPAGPGPWYIEAPDLNADGRPDLIVANSGSSGDGGVSLLANETSEGSEAVAFGAPQDLAAGLSTQSIGAGDFDGDGRLDLAIGSFFTSDRVPGSGRGLYLYANRTEAGAREFRFSPPTELSAGTGPESIAVADFNADGMPDLGFSDYGIPGAETTQDVSVILNRTRGAGESLEFSNRTAFRAGRQPLGLVAADVNDDDRPDLVVTDNFSFDVAVLLNRTPAGADSPSFADAVPFSAGSAPIGPETLAVGDLNRDGRPDVVTPNFLSDHDVSVLLNTTPSRADTPRFARRVDFETGIGPQHVAIEDLDGDAVPDVAVANYGGLGERTPAGVSIFANRTQAGGERPVLDGPASFSAGRAPTALAAADYNGDRRPDLAVSNHMTLGDAGVSVLLNETPFPACRALPSVRLGRVRLGRRGASLRGTAAPAACPTAPPVRRVEVSLSRRVHRGCRDVGAGGRLGRTRPCIAGRFVRARGTDRFVWSLRTRGNGLPAGRYLVRARAVDGEGHTGAVTTREVALR